MAGPKLNRPYFLHKSVRTKLPSCKNRASVPNFLVCQLINRTVFEDKKIPQLSLKSMSVEVFIEKIVAHLQTFDPPPFFPRKLEPELLHHTCKCRLCWHRPHFNVPTHDHRDDRIYNWPFSSNNAFATLFTLFAAGCKTTPWNIVIIHHCCSRPFHSAEKTHYVLHF